MTHDSRNIKEKQKWKEKHKKTFHRACLQWPPVYAADFQEMIAANVISEREAEYIHFLGRTSPMEQLAIEDELVDISQSLGRQSNRHCGYVPCILAGSRIWLRRRKRFLLAPEAIKAQGFDPPASCLLKRFDHRRVFDIVGNSFHADSCLCALTVALASAPQLQQV